jgi:acetyl esterase/lipase
MLIRRLHATLALSAFAATLTLGLHAQAPAAPPAPPAADAAETAPAAAVKPKVSLYAAEEFRDIAYGHQSNVDQLLDVYTNAASKPGKPAPVLVYFHGGAWHKGQRPGGSGSFNGFMKMGFTVVNVEYRFSQVATAPAAVQDARCALAWVKANAAKYNFDVTRIVPYGTSAGGHLALMAGMLPIPSDIDLPACKDVPPAAAILDFYGPAELAPGMAGAFKSPSVAEWIGPKKDPVAYANLMSPINYVRKGDPPVFIAHGGSDPVVPHATSERLQAALTAVGVPTDFYTVPGAGHGQFPKDQMLIIYDRVQAFLAQQKILPPK